jgi:hypothetical protein
MVFLTSTEWQTWICMQIDTPRQHDHARPLMRAGQPVATKLTILSPRYHRRYRKEVENVQSPGSALFPYSHIKTKNETARAVGAPAKPGGL